MKKRVLPIMISICLAVTMLVGVNITASAWDDISTPDFVLLQGQVNTANPGDTIKLEKNYDLGDDWVAISKELTLDLNGYTVSSTNNCIQVVGNSELTLIDRSSSKAGKLTTTFGSALNVLWGSTLNIYSGNIESTQEDVDVINNSGTLNIYGGNFSSSADYSYLVSNYNNGTCTISGGSFSVFGNSSMIICNVFGSGLITGGSFYTEQGSACTIQNKSGPFEVNGGTFSAKSGSSTKMDIMDPIIISKAIFKNGLVLTGGFYGLAEILSSSSDYYDSENNPVDVGDSSSYTEGLLSVSPPVSQQTITDLDTEKVTASGLLSVESLLVIQKIESTEDVYNELLTKAGDVDLVGAFELSVQGSFLGDLTVTFNIGTEYNGKTVTILHKKSSGEIETFTKTVAEGKVTITVTELSPFLISVAKSAAVTTTTTAEKTTTPATNKTPPPNTPNPKTSDFAPIILLIGLTVLSVATITVVSNKKKFKIQK